MLGAPFRIRVWGVLPGSFGSHVLGRTAARLLRGQHVVWVPRAGLLQSNVEPKPPAPLPATLTLIYADLALTWIPGSPFLNRSKS